MHDISSPPQQPGLWAYEINSDNQQLVIWNKCLKFYIKKTDKQFAVWN